MRSPCLRTSASGNHLSSRTFTGVVFLALGLLLLLALRAQTASPLTAQPAAAAYPRRTPVVEAVARVRAAVVNIHSERTVKGPIPEEFFATAPSQNRINGMGTGVLVDPRGYVVTNEHVVEEVNVIHIRLSDGTTHPAHVLARNQENDLALLKIDVDRALPTMPLGTAADLMVGETVIAIGNAYGYEHTVSEGIVSAVKRDVTLNKEVSYKSLIQTDASINPGNSGGPLLNINGEMIGINVAIRAGAQGISFAIPVDTMIRVVAEMLASRRQKGTWHGLVCHDQLDPVPATTAGLAEGMVRSLVVERTEPGSPADQGGVQAGDVLTRVGDLNVASNLDLERALIDTMPGEHVTVVAHRHGAEQRCELQLQAADPDGPALADLVWRKLGLRLSPVSGELVSRSNERFTGGLTVTDLNAEGAAAKAGIQRGDILVGLHQWKMLSLENVTFVLNHHDLATFTPLVFYVIRSNQVHRGWLQQLD